MLLFVSLFQLWEILHLNLNPLSENQAFQKLFKNSKIRNRPQSKENTFFLSYKHLVAAPGHCGVGTDLLQYGMYPCKPRY